MDEGRDRTGRCHRFTRSVVHADYPNADAHRSDMSKVMLPAGVIHYRRHEPRNVWLNVVILFLCLFVTYDRFI